MAIIFVLGIIVFLIMVHPIIFGILAALLGVIFIIVVVLSIKGGSASHPSRGRRHYYRRSSRRSKSFLRVMFDGQKRTQKRNGSHRGVMSGPGGVGPRGGKRRKYW